MGKKWYEVIKPRVSTRVQLLLAGAMWSIVGAGLLAAGAEWIYASLPFAPSTALLLAGMLLGAVKSRLLIDGTAQKIVSRIGERGDGRCAGGFLSVRSWIFVLVMVLAGRLLRKLLLPAPAGTLYVAVGVALLLSSRHAWRAWRTGRLDGSSGLRP